MQRGRTLVKGFHHVAIVVKDVEKSRAFYEGVLNLEPIPRPDFGFEGQWYQMGPQELHLMQKETVRNQVQHFAIETTDIGVIFEKLKAKGVSIVSPPGKRPHDNSDFMFCLDPDGNLIEITHHW